MRRHLLFVLATLILVAAQRGQAGAILDLDMASYRGSDTLGFVEVYTAIQRSGLAYSPEGTMLKADFRVLLEILNAGEVAMTDTFLAQDVIDSAEAKSLTGQYFTHAFRFIMLPGTYGLRASLFQTAANPRDVVNDTLVVPAFGTDSLRLSDVELGSKLEFVKETSPFVKNGVMVIPNPTGFFGTRLPLFYYYLEAYGLDYDAAGTDSFVVTQRVLDAESGKSVRPETRKGHRTKGTTAVIADGFPVTAMRTGSYLLEVQVTSVRSDRAVVTQKKFWTFRKEDLADGRTFVPQPTYKDRLTDVAPDFLDVVDADSALLWMKYSMTREEIGQVKRLNLEGKRAFLNNYWKAKEAEEPGSANRYFARVVEANRRYTYLKRPGWKTDRGRVFITYGEPDRVVKSSVASSVVDNEVWEYDKLRGGVTFVFADMRGYGDYDMVHSTMPGEIYNPNWYVTGAGGRPGSQQDMH